MTQPNRPIGEDDLTAYVDGELTADRRALVEQWLASHPESQRRVLEDQQIKRRLAESLGPLASASLPDQLRVEHIQTDRTVRRMASVQRMAAVVALIALSGGGGWYLRGSSPVPTYVQTEVQAAVAAHNVFAPEKLHPVEVSADARDHLGTWLGNRIGKPVSIPDLRTAGLSLLGGRLLPGGDGQPAGQLMYETATGERVTLYIQSGYGQQTAFVFAREDEIGTLAWRSPELAYVLSGAVDQNDLLEIAHAVYEWEL